MSTSNPVDISAADVSRRRFHRFPVEGLVRLYSGNAMWNTRLVDLSLSGVLVEPPEQWNGVIGNRYRLDVRLEGGVMIGMGVELARIEKDIGLGFNCIKIDLGSFAQLKRLIELNLGNYKTLQHELSVLGD